MMTAPSASRPPMSRALALGCVVAGIMGGACTSSEQCARDAECGDGALCGADGTCRRAPVDREPTVASECVHDDECGASEACVDGLCTFFSIGSEGEGEGMRLDPCIDPRDDDVTTGRCAPAVELPATAQVEPATCSDADRVQGRCTGDDPPAPPPAPCNADDPHDGRDCS
jgi:hypothetical protein